MIYIYIFMNKLYNTNPHPINHLPAGMPQQYPPFSLTGAQLWLFCTVQGAQNHVETWDS